jgi:hypothetical protein
MTIEGKISSQDHTIVQQLERQFKTQLKLKLWRRVVAIIIATGSSRRIQEGVDEVIFRPAALL